MMLILPLVLTTIALAAPSDNQIVNGNFEDTGKGDVPTGWEKIVIGVAPTFRIDHDAHVGKSAACIDAPEQTRAYLSSSPIPVAPGEKLVGSAWVRVNDVQKGMGAVILIAQFSRADGSNASVAKVGVADVTKNGWQQIKGPIEVPEDVEQLRLRAGFSYTKGTCCWDDVEVHSEQPVVARVSLPGNRLSPAMEAIPVTVINRTGAKTPLHIALSLDDAPFAADVKLDGKHTQTVNVPVSIDKRGKAKLALNLHHKKDDKPFLTQSIALTIPPPIVLDPPSPTHWASQDGPPQIDGDVLLALKPKTSSGAKLIVNLLDESNKVRATWSTQKLGDGVNSYSIKPGALPQGKYSIEAVVQPAGGGGQPMRSTQDWFIIPRSKAKVTINEQGFCVADGKPVFPMGVFNSGDPEELAEAGFTVTHAYNATRVAAGVRPDDRKMLEYLDHTEKVGMKSLTMVPLEFAAHGEWDAFRRRIRMFRNHPAILAWDEEEGLARGDWKMETLVKVRQILKEEDPNHPFMVGDARDVIFRVKDRSNFFALDQLDMGMWWWYPLPLKKEKRIDALEGEEVSGLELTPPAFLTQAKTNKPIWVGVQSYKKENTRFPTPIEYRAQAYIAIAEGGKGLMWYGGYVTGGMFQAQNKTDAHWPEVKQLVTELKSLQDVFIGATETKPTLTPSDAPVSVALKRSPQRLVLIAANRGEKPVELTITSPAIKAGAVKVISEDRTVRAGAGQITDKFEPYGVHVYQLP